MPNTCTLYAPGLFGPAVDYTRLTAHDWPQLDILAKCLSRAQQQPFISGSMETDIFNLLTGQAVPVIPMAALRQFPQPATGNDWCCDPVYVQLDRDQILLTDNQLLELNEDEATQLLASLNQHFSEIGLQFTAIEPHAWVMQQQQAWRLQTHALSSAIWQDVAQYSPQGQQASVWQSTLNEIQMLLHQHPVNLAREAQGRMMVNSVWLWGDGELPPPPTDTDKLVYTDNANVQIICDWAGVVCLPLPLQLTAEDFKQSNTIVIEQRLATSTRQRDVLAYLQDLYRLQQNILQPLLFFLDNRTLDEVVLVTDGAFSYRLTRQLLRRWWKRVTPMPAILQRYHAC